jgi:hypothetical protein
MFPPGMFVYGLPPYERLVNERIGRVLRGPLRPIGQRAQRVITRLSHGIMHSLIASAQGWYTDLWAGPRVEFAFPPPRGRVLALAVALPPWLPYARQRLEFSTGGRIFARETFGKGEFVIAVRASSSFRPPRAREGVTDKRKLSYLLRSFDYEV